jgi:hypothetical protein
VTIVVAGLAHNSAAGRDSFLTEKSISLRPNAAATSSSLSLNKSSTSILSASHTANTGGVKEDRSDDRSGFVMYNGMGNVASECSSQDKDTDTQDGLLPVRARAADLLGQSNAISASSAQVLFHPCL